MESWPATTASAPLPNVGIYPLSFGKVGILVSAGKIGKGMQV